MHITYIHDLHPIFSYEVYEYKLEIPKASSGNLALLP